MAIHFNPIEIVEAYYTKYTTKKDSPRYKLAQERLKICETCEERAYNETAKVYYCGKCGCIIGGKVFSKHENPCPLKKWKKCDQNFHKNFPKTSLI